MLRSRSRCWLLLIIAATTGLEGCIAEDTTGDGKSEPEAPAAFDPRIVLSYNMTATCMITEMSLPGSRESAERFLPEGFRVADDVDPFAVVVETCDGATGDNMALVVRINTPKLEPRVYENISEAAAWFERPICDGSTLYDEYFVAGYSASRFWVQRYRQSGVPTEAATLTLSSTVAGNPLREAALVRGEATEGGDALFSFDAAIVEGGTVRTCRSTWHQTDHGLMLVREWRLHNGASTGPSTCRVADGSPFAWALDESACARGTARVAPAVERTGYAFWFHETFANGTY